MKKIIYLFFIFLSFVFFVSNVSADTIESIGYLNNSNVYLNNTTTNVSINVPKETLNTNNDLTWNKFIFNTTYTFSANKYYVIELSLPNAYFTNAYNFDIKSGSVICSLMGYDDSDIHFPKISFTCPSTITYLTIEINSGGSQSVLSSYSFRWNYAYLSEIKSDVDLTPIINNQTQNTQNIINNNDTNTQNIINNNDENTQRIIDENKKNFETCRDSYNLFDEQYQLGTINTSTGALENSTTIIRTTNFQNIEPSTKYTLLLPNGVSGILLYYYNNNTYISSRQPTISNGKVVFTTLSDANKIKWRFNSGYTTLDNQTMLYKGDDLISYEPYGEQVCTNKLDEQTNAINNLDDTLKDDNIDENGLSNAFDDFNSFLDENSTITQLIILPITLYTAILNNVNGTCQPFNLGALYGENLVLPCINVSQYLGNTLWNMIDIIISGFAIYSISKKMIKVFNNFSSLKEGDVIDD